MQSEVTLDTVLSLAKHLSTRDKVRLIEQIAPQIERELDASQPARRESLLGFLAGSGPAPSGDEIDEARREAWANFPREDI